MQFSKVFSFTPSKEVQKSQNESIALEIAQRLTNLLQEFQYDYEEGIPIIYESLTNLAKKDRDLTQAILKVLIERHSDIHKKYPFKINS